MAVDRNSPLPLWAQVLADIRARLEAGEFAERFPTDNELISRYQVSRHTVREAMRRLQDEGVVSRERGRGSFLALPSLEQPTGAIYSLFRSIEARGLEQRSEVLDLSETTDGEAAGHLGLRATAKVVRLERIRLVDGQPLAHDTAWLPATIARPLLGVDFTRTALYDELARAGRTGPTAGQEWISTELPGRREREVLGLPARQPVFRIRRLGEADGRPVEWRETVVRGDRYTFVASWSANGDYETSLTPSPPGG